MMISYQVQLPGFNAVSVGLEPTSQQASAGLSTHGKREGGRRPEACVWEGVTRGLPDRGGVGLALGGCLRDGENDPDFRVRCIEEMTHRKECGARC